MNIKKKKKITWFAISEFVLLMILTYGSILS